MSELLRILFADDCESNRTIIDLFNRNLNLAQIDWAEDGAMAVELFEQSKYDLVVLDNQMPIIMGVDVAKILIANGCQVPIALWTTDYSIKDSKPMGITEFWEKPLRKFQFRDYISAHHKRVFRENYIFRVA